jgi:hypothetical protein
MAGCGTDCVVHRGCVAAILLWLKRMICKGRLRFYLTVSIEDAALFGQFDFGNLKLYVR